MPELIGADSDQLRRPAFRPYLEHMIAAQQVLVAGTGPPQPVPPRADIDHVVNRVLPESWETLSIVIDGLVALPNLDAEGVQGLAGLIEVAAGQMSDTAGRAITGPRP
jgi:hypothetical protein